MVSHRPPRHAGSRLRTTAMWWATGSAGSSGSAAGCDAGRLTRTGWGGGAAAAHTTFTVARILQVPRAGAEGIGIVQHGVDLPSFTGRAAHPDLVLGGKATGGADFLVGKQSLTAEAGDLGMHLLAGLDFD